MYASYIKFLQALFILSVGVWVVFYGARKAEQAINSIAKPRTAARIRKIIVYTGILLVMFLALYSIGAHISFNIAITYPPEKQGI